MKMKTILNLLLFSLVLSSKSFANWDDTNWTKIFTSDGISVFLDYDRVREKNGFIYYRKLYDRTTPNKLGSYSVMEVIQGDCAAFRLKILDQHQHKNQMGKGSYQSILGDGQWIYPKSNQFYGYTLDQICSR